MNTRTAVKEWSGVIDALGKGQQTLLIRKYAPPAKDFLLYPTFTYCNSAKTAPESFEKMIKSDFRASALEIGEKTRVRAQDNCLVDFEYCASVAEVIEVGKPSQFSALSPYFIWSTSHVQEYASQAKNGCFVWVLRVFRLPSKIEIGRISQGGPPTVYYHHKDIVITKPQPILSDLEFENHRQKILDLLGSAQPS